MTLEGNILVVDDSTDLLEVFHYFLNLAGLTVKSLLSAELIFEEVKHFTPDVILLDVLMPGMGGRTICKLLKTNPLTKHIPIILMSANPKFLIDYKECYADDILEKPFDISTVLSKINAVIKRSDAA